MRAPIANACVCRYVRHPSVGTLSEQRDVEIDFFDTFADLNSGGPCTLLQVEEQLSKAAAMHACAADASSHAAQRAGTTSDENDASANRVAADEKEFYDNFGDKPSSLVDGACLLDLLASATQVRPLGRTKTSSFSAWLCSVPGVVLMSGIFVWLSTLCVCHSTTRARPVIQEAGRWACD